MNRIFIYAAGSAALALAVLTAPDVAIGKERVRGQYATSKQPYRSVGTIDKQLSSACQRGEFRQRKYLVFSIGFNGTKGRGITGIAQKNWNLIDKKGLAKPDRTYHFFNQGYSNCKVYVAKTPIKRRQ
jgi:hypothetical protein